MPSAQGLRERKKAQTRERLADLAAELFAAHGYDDVSIQDVARAADVSDQTVYNYFPQKHELVLDRIEEFRELYDRAVRGRPDGTTPASALRPLVDDDIERYVNDDATRARGQFPAQSVASPVLRRFALEAREQQVETIAAAILDTSTVSSAILARAHAAALVSVIQTITDRIGASVLVASGRPDAAREMLRDAHLAFEDLDRSFRTTIGAESARGTSS